MTEDLEVVETEPNRVSGSPDQICFKLPAEEKTAFMSRLAKDGEKATPLLRVLVREYMERGQAEASLSVAERKRAELNTYVLDKLRAFAAKKRSDKDFLDWFGAGFGLRPGTLASLLEE